MYILGPDSVDHRVGRNVSIKLVMPLPHIAGLNHGRARCTADVSSVIYFKERARDTLRNGETHVDAVPSR